MKTCTTCGGTWPDDTKFCPNDGTTLRSAQGSGSLIGSVVADRYHIEKKLGEGGMGAVYLGQHVKMGRKSAIKVMSQSMANDPEAIARFNREANNAARITHPNVCAIYDFGETPDGLIYLAMEFIEGQSLSDLLRAQGALPPQRAVSILKQTADALQAAHDLGIVHRDLKPDNIMLAKGRDGSDLVKVVDFGIAKAMTGEEGQKVTKTGLVVGTPEYMSPEQLSGDVLDGRSDIYSLALVFYRMITGALPFQADSAQEMMIKRLTDRPIPLNEAVPGANFPARLQQAVDHALERMPPDRYASAVEFARDVEQAVRGFGGAATGVTAEASTQLIDAAATARLPQTRVGRGAGPTTPATPAPVVSPPPTKKKAPVVAIVGAVAVLAVGGGTVAMMLRGGGNGDQQAGPDSLGAGGRVTNPTAQPAESVQTEDLGSNARPGTDSQRQPPAPGGTPTGGTGQPAGQPAAGPNAEAVLAELDRMEQRALDGTAGPEVPDSAEAWYLNRSLPEPVRAKAAAVAGTWFSDRSEMAQACTWFRRAVDLEPNNRTYGTLRDRHCQ